jgi:hypothetical protein
MSTHVLDCGCVVVTGKERIERFCPTHQAQYDELHARAAADYERRTTGVDRRQWIEQDTSGFSDAT